jgi:Uma2 family endonuclease
MLVVVVLRLPAEGRSSERAVMASVATSVIFEDQIEVPLTVGSLADFRRWALSDEFPEAGRIDFIGGRIEVEMAPEDFFCHGGVKTEIARVVSHRVKRLRLGHLQIDRTRISCSEANLSVEPDLVFISYETFASGRARLVPKTGRHVGHYVEVEGPPDLVVEIVSDSSMTKDTRRLPSAYFQAGVREFWLADARGETPIFIIHRPGAEGFEPVVADADGFQPSAVLGCRYRLDSARDANGHWEFDLREEE